MRGHTGPSTSDCSNIHRWSRGTRERSWQRTAKQVFPALSARRSLAVELVAKHGILEKPTNGLKEDASEGLEEADGFDNINEDDEAETESIAILTLYRSRGTFQ